MKLGLVGLPMSGKTTIFNALTGADRPTNIATSGKLDVQIQVVDVPDPRLDALYDIFIPQRKVHAKITYADIGGLAKGVSKSGLSGQFRNQLSQMDGFLYVVRAFDDPNVAHPEQTIDPQRDIDILDSEFMLADLLTVEHRVTRLKEELSKGKDRDINARELAIFERLQAQLEEGKPLRDMGLPVEDMHALRGYGFLSLKPRLVIVNTGDEGIDDNELPHPEGLYNTVLPIRGRLEAEISQLEPDEAALFLEEYGIEKPMRSRAIEESYRTLHIQTFFTIGDDEVRAWPVRIGATAQQAAGIIHTDFERGFIRAEICPWDELVELGGLSELRKTGKLRLEGRGYLIQDGDVMTVRANV